jgi:hypothetical protein
MKSVLAEKVDTLLGELEGVEPPFESLGTPVLGELYALEKLVSMGADIVPHLVERTGEAVGAKRLAYLALVLGRIGERQAAEPLRALRTRYQARSAKDEWDYAVIGQCDVALSRLSKSGG